MATGTHWWRSLKRLKRQSSIEVAWLQADFRFRDPRIPELEDGPRRDRYRSDGRRGRVLTVADRRGGVTTNHYDMNGFLTSVDGPLSGADDTFVMTYDALGRVTLPTHASLPQLRAVRASRGTTWSDGAGEHNFGGDRASGGNVAVRRQTTHCGRGRASARAAPGRTARGASIQQDFDLRRITNERQGRMTRVVTISLCFDTTTISFDVSRSGTQLQEGD